MNKVMQRKKIARPESLETTTELVSLQQPFSEAATQGRC